MTAPHFNGAGYNTGEDHSRLSIQYQRIFTLMEDAEWRTLDQISALTTDPPASVSAQLRHMRKKRFGSHVVERRYLGHGLYEYRLLVNPEQAP